MKTFFWKNIFVSFFVLLIVIAGIYFALKNDFDKNKILASLSYQKNISQNNINFISRQEKLKNPPEEIRAVYINGYSAGTKTYLKYLDGVIENNKINAVVIDIKGSDGWVYYDSKIHDVKKYNLSNRIIKDINFLIKHFHDRNIYVIGRISVFEDPLYAKARPELAVYDNEKSTETEKILWQDYNGLMWLDPASQDVWDYNISLAKDAFYHGFDEINFDYVRFPTDGNIEKIGFPIYNGKISKSEVMNNFFKYLREKLANEKISIDLFGLTTIKRGDIGIGQILENAFENFDYISPMVYPSHYAKGFMGFLNPAEYPYEVIKYSMDEAMLRKNAYPVKLSVKFRPWIQDFNIGAEYNSEMIKKEIQAVKDSLEEEYVGFMIWNPSNIYTKFEY